jgi:quercetin dioxygenase-like cupin family protein
MQSSAGASAPTEPAGMHPAHVDQSPGNFVPGPPFFPAGSQIAVLQGDPSQNGEFTVRLKFPAGYVLPPHFHPTDENVTVLSGTFLVGLGDVVKPDSAIRLKAGGFITAPANGHHFAVSRTETLVQVHGLGPFAITYVNPADDPRN